MENLIFHFSDFLGEKERFIEYLNKLYDDKKPDDKEAEVEKK